MADLQTQAAHDVQYLRYWVDEGAGKIFCHVDAPSPEANTVHREAHGLVADEIYAVQEGPEVLRLFWGRSGLLGGLALATALALVPAAAQAGQRTAAWPQH